MSHHLNFFDGRAVRYLAQNDDATLAIGTHAQTLLVNLNVWRLPQHLGDELNVLG